MKLLNSLFLLLLTFSYAIADDKKTEKELQKYDVNIIIFEDAHARYLNAERWNSDATAEEAEQASAITENEEDTHTDNVTTDEFVNIQPVILNSQYKRINRSSEYNVLFYGGWRQTGLDKTNAYEINIEELKNNHPSKSKNTISGHLKLVLSRYLHMYGELEYHKEVTTATTESDATESNADTSKVQTFDLSLQRKMRSKVLHYIDHPMVGILVQINPTETKPQKTVVEPKEKL